MRRGVICIPEKGGKTVINNKGYYPTPKSLIIKMVAKIQNKNAKKYLDPSGGHTDA